MKAMIQISMIFILMHTLFGVDVKAATKLTPVKSSIDNVLLFPDRAIVTRKVSVTVRPPGQAIYFDKLPGSLDSDSLRAKISNNKAANILGIRSRVYRIKKSEVENKEYREWRAKQEKYDKEMQVLRETAQRLVRENNHLNELLNHYRSSFPHNLHEGKWSDKQFRAFSKLALDRSNKMYKSWSKIFKQYIDLANKREFALGKLAQLSKYAPKGWRRVWVDLRVFKKQKVDLEIEYLVNKASWRSSYAIQINSKTKKAKFIQQALIQQKTGEDWTKAKIVLSNYQSKLKAKAPSNSSYRLSYRKVEKVKTSVKGTSKKNKNIVASSTTAVNPTEKIFREFPIKGKVTLPSGLPELKVLIDDYSLSYEKFYETIPAKMQMVYQRTKLKNTIPFALARGPVDVYVDGLYHQQFQLPFTSNGKPIQINTGYNYDVQVSRRVNNKTGKSGLLGGKKEYKRTITNTVTNWSQDKVKLRVYEQSPKSEMDEIEVESKPSPAKFTADKEFETWSYWELQLDPNRSRSLELSLKVVAPEDFGFSW
jgi:uncharacterized protein (TIGR02231 family)